MTAETPTCNAAADLIARMARPERARVIAVVDDQGQYTYAEVVARVGQVANLLAGLGLPREARVMICQQDSVDWPAVFLGSILAGLVPVTVSTLLTSRDYDFLLRDSRAGALFVSGAVLAAFAPILEGQPHLKHVITVGSSEGDHRDLAAALRNMPAAFSTVDTHPDEAAFWQYSSGSTGSPKGTVHVHASLLRTAELYAEPILSLTADDTVFSVAKLFFGYGLGNGMTFPFYAGAKVVLSAERCTPALAAEVLRRHRITVFCGVPTLYAGLLASEHLPAPAEVALRRCVSAGEALPAAVGRAWKAHFSVDILDGIGSTEMLHIFLSNRPDDLRYGTTGKPLDGYTVRLVDEAGADVAPGVIGELLVRGPTAAASYWNRRDRSQATFIGDWVKSGDKYQTDPDGYFVYCGRSDDMLKVSGIYVSPFEVEAELSHHEAILEAAVVGAPDNAGLIKPKAFVVLKPGAVASDALALDIQAFIKARLAPYKYPRWVTFVDDLPKTATGKIQRFRLRLNEQDL